MDAVKTINAKPTKKHNKAAAGFKLFIGNGKAVFGAVLLLLFLVFAAIGPVLYEYHHDGYALGSRLQAPNEEYRMGLDELGRDVFGAIIYGARASLMIGFFVTLLVVIVGTALGITAGYIGGVFDIIIMRITEAFMLVPFMPLVLTLAAIVGQRFSNIIIILGLTSWPGTARLVRAQTLTIKQRNYVERARALGAGSGYIMFRHILPNVFPLIFSNIILLVQNAIIAESTLAFLGIGDPSIPTWGQLLRSAREESAVVTNSWWMFIPAGACIVLLASSFVFISYGFDEILNPKLRKR
ncbi:MAG: ABC transporter permease [Clostridiales bacterium]|jgi:peptide/nickel transport system permease protein|nr:ABC transporter permease [Clostridiales bacterium]